MHRMALVSDASEAHCLLPSPPPDLLPYICPPLSVHTRNCWQKENRRAHVLAALVCCILGQCLSIYILFGEEIWRNLVMMPAPTPRAQLPLPVSPAPLAPSPAPAGATSATPVSAAAAQPAPAPKPHMNILDVLWFVTMDDLMARHGGMMLKALTVMVCPLAAMKHLRVAQVPCTHARTHADGCGRTRVHTQTHRSVA
jgi:hypothetical protein